MTKEKLIEEVSTKMLDILSRFANVTSVNVTEKKQQFFTSLHFETNTLPMTPRVHKDLYISGNGRTFKDDKGNEFIRFEVNWRWSEMNFGMNGTRLCFVEFLIDGQELRLRYLTF